MSFLSLPKNRANSQLLIFIMGMVILSLLVGCDQSSKARAQELFEGLVIVFVIFLVILAILSFLPVLIGAIIGGLLGSLIAGPKGAEIGAIIGGILGYIASRYSV